MLHTGASTPPLKLVGLNQKFTGEPTIPPNGSTAFVKPLLGESQTSEVAPSEASEVPTASSLPSAAKQVGDRVNWSKCPAHCEQFAPFEITAIDGDYAKLDLFEKPVLLCELTKE
ncbi:MAG: hypothetical protein KME25_26110 [Symplocastrum torsivum CPER-KK1]|jgi:hypothetical protein|uniref:Uncharacterized protein n=1 Tax=Symplocastrum torsivum CPER-KK1 TaxID=450513 RepID=A0A951UC72_9CYAN|nr:hypothetical protein [Symplocastrum torsivum CPER-KK1]